MTRKTIVILLGLALLLPVAGLASASVINNTTYRIQDLGGLYYNHGTPFYSFYGYHLDDSGTVTGLGPLYGDSTMEWAAAKSVNGGACVAVPSTGWYTNGALFQNAGTLQSAGLGYPLRGYANSAGTWIFPYGTGGYTMNGATGAITARPTNWTSGYQATCINAGGMMGGGNSSNGNLYNGGALAGQLLALPNSVPTYATTNWVGAINDLGQAVGTNSAGGGTFTVVNNGAATGYWAAGTTTISGQAWWAPLAISPNGKYVAGLDNVNWAPYLYTASGVGAGTSAGINTTSLGNSGYGWATVVNNNGWVGGDTDDMMQFGKTGWVRDAGGTLHSSDIQTMLTSIAPGYSFAGVWGINSSNQILIWGRPSSGYMKSFLLSPVPEPSTLLLLASGAIGLLAYAWRKRK